MKRPLLSLALVGLISACGQNSQNPNYTGGYYQTTNANCYAGSYNYPACLSYQGVNNSCSSFNSSPIYEGSQLIGYRSRQTLIGSSVTQNTAQSQIVLGSTQVNVGEKIFVNFTGAVVYQPQVHCELGGLIMWTGPTVAESISGSDITVVTPNGNFTLTQAQAGQGITMTSAGTVSVRIQVGAQCAPVQTTVQLQSGNAGAVEVERCCTTAGVVGSCPQ